MKIEKFILIILFVIFSLLHQSDIKAENTSDLQKVFLDKHFVGKKYDIWEKKLITKSMIFKTAVHYVDYQNKIIDDAVVFSMVENHVVPYLYFKPDKILNGKKGIIFDLSKHPYKFYGWGLEYSYPKNKKFSPGFSTISFAESGKRVTDGPNLQWNSIKESFEKVRFDNM